MFQSLVLVEAKTNNSPINVGSCTIAGPGLLVSAAIRRVRTVGVQGRCSILPAMVSVRIIRSGAQGPVIFGFLYLYLRKPTCNKNYTYAEYVNYFQLHSVPHSFIHVAAVLGAQSGVSVDDSVLIFCLFLA